MTDLTGITITPGVVPGQLKESLAETVNRIGAKMIDGVRIDTTHFVCTEPRGQAWEKAVEMNVPVVVPDWVKGCEREGRIVGVRGYYLDADPKLRQVGPGQGQSQQTLAAQRMSVGSTQQARDSPRIERTPPTPERTTHDSNGGAAVAPPEPPTPPQKPANERRAEVQSDADADADRDANRDAVTGTTVVAREAPPDEDEDGENEEEREGEDSDDTEKASPDSERHPMEKGKGRIPHEHAEDGKKVATPQTASEDGKFDDVAL